MCRVLLLTIDLSHAFSHSLPKATSAADGDAKQAAPLPKSVLSLGTFDEDTLRERADSLLRDEARYTHMDHLHAVSAFQTETRKLEKNFVVSRVHLAHHPLHILTQQFTHRSTRGDDYQSF